MPDRDKSSPETGGRCLGENPDTCRVAIVDKPFIVRGKITFALGVNAKDARYASDLVRDALDSLEGWVPKNDKLPYLIVEWEVLTEQIERN